MDVDSKNVDIEDKLIKTLFCHVKGKDELLNIKGIQWQKSHFSFSSFSFSPDETKEREKAAQ